MANQFLSGVVLIYGKATPGLLELVNGWIES